MLKAFVIYAAVACVLVVAMIANRRSTPEPVRHRSVLQRSPTPDDTQ